MTGLPYAVAQPNIEIRLQGLTFNTICNPLHLNIYFQTLLASGESYTLMSGYPQPQDCNYSLRVVPVPCLDNCLRLDQKVAVVDDPVLQAMSRKFFQLLPWRKDNR